MSYERMLLDCKKSYPFNYWLEDFENGIGVYDKQNCELVSQVFDAMLDALINEGESATEEDKIRHIEVAVKSLNQIREKKPKLIETMEREEFCDLFDEIAKAIGVDSEKYGGGDGIASEWRTW